jgi:hypothetical protein
MPYERNDDDRRNDTRLLTPLLVMGLIVAAGFLFNAFAGHVPPTSG